MFEKFRAFRVTAGRIWLSTKSEETVLINLIEEEEE